MFFSLKKTMLKILLWAIGALYQSPDKGGGLASKSNNTCRPFKISNFFLRQLEQSKEKESNPGSISM
jgi:hypothetical protein